MEYRRYFYSYQGISAVKHLFRVTAGLDSMVVGEDQILGQVKKAHQTALEVGTSKTFMNTLFKDAITAAKAIKYRMNKSKVPGSVASLAVNVVRQHLKGDLSGKTVLLIGAGEISGLVLTSLANSGVKKLMIASRNRRLTIDNQNQPVEYIDYNDRYEVIDEADLIFSATASPHYTITRDKLEKSLITRKERLLIDLAVPRDIDEDSRTIPGVVYFNLDSLKANIEIDWDFRTRASIKIDKIINEYVLSFERWYEFRNTLPLMREIQDSAQGYVTEKINDTIAKLTSADDKDKEVVQKAMHNLANFLLNKYVYSVKENVSGDEVSIYFKCLSRTVNKTE